MDRALTLPKRLTITFERERRFRRGEIFSLLVLFDPNHLNNGLELNVYHNTTTRLIDSLKLE